MEVVKKYLKRVYYRLRSNCTTEELQRKGLKVDVHAPDFVLNIDVRENGKTFV